MTRQDERIGLDAWLLAIYFALSPMHQTLVLSNGSTVVKYLAFGVMIACIIWGYIENRSFMLSWDLLWPILLILGWFALTILWADSRSTAISSFITIGSYCALLLIIGSRRWNNKEKLLFITIIILSCLLYSVQLINTSGTAKRATLKFVFGETETEADQNAVAGNIGVGLLFAFYCFLQQKKGFIKWAALASSIIILVGIICTGSRGGVIAISAGALYMIIKQSEIDQRMRNRYILIVCSVLVLIWLIFDINILQNEYIRTRFQNVGVDSLNGRFEIWSQYIDVLTHRPIGFLCGYGCGCDTIAYASYLGRNWFRVSHNDIISILCQSGIPGLMLTGSFILHIWRNSKIKDDFLGCACIILSFIISMDINYFKTYGWWNCLIFTYIGLGTLTEYNSVSYCYYDIK